MSRERWAEVERILDGALDLPPTERAAYLDTACTDAPEIRREVEALLAHVETETGLLDTPPPFVARELLDDPPKPAVEVEPGTQLGPYQVVELIGRGGMGAVYLAERADGTFEKQVALKVIQRSVASRETMRRFDDERRILARLEHPNIAGILDGGVTHDGLPYLVMDLALGDTIDVSCDRMRHDVTTRLRAFRTVADAVQYAHRNLVVHRDLKPSNIVVTTDGGVRLLDFGIAKALDQDDGQGDSDSLEASPRLTPEYAAPEQVLGEPTTAATDVYSLGVVLYELLTGTRPYEIEDRTMAAVTEAVCHKEPKPPSQVVSERGDLEVAQARSTTTSGLRQGLTGDLDAILLKALQKDPDRRYNSVGEFSDDILRHLEGRPVRARPATRWYRTTKFIQRYRVQVLAVSTAVIALLAGIVGTTLLYQTASRERDLRMLEAERASLASNFLTTTLADLGPEARGSEPITPGEIIEIGKTRLNDLDARPRLHAAITTVLAEVSLSLSQFAQADSLFREAVAILDSIPEGASLDLARAYTGLGYTTLRSGAGRAEAVPLFEQALALREDVLGPTDSLVLSSKADLGFGLYASSRYDESIQWLQSSLDHPSPAGRRARALEFLSNTLTAQGMALRDEGDAEGAARSFASAKQALTDGLTLIEAGHDEAPGEEITLLASLVHTNLSLGDTVAALDAGARAAEIATRVYDDRGQRAGLAHSWYGDALLAAGRLPEAVAAYELGYTAYLSSGPGWARTILSNLTVARIDAGRFADAESTLLDFMGDPPYTAADTQQLALLARVYEAWNRPGDAVQIRTVLQTLDESAAPPP